VLQNDAIALSINELLQLFISCHQQNSLSAWQCWSAFRFIHDNLLAYQSGAFSVIFTSEYQSSYLFTYKNVLLKSSN